MVFNCIIKFHLLPLLLPSELTTNTRITLVDAFRIIRINEENIQTETRLMTATLNEYDVFVKSEELQ